MFREGGTVRRQQVEFLESLGWQTRRSNVVVGTETLASVARRFGTPLYLYDASIVLDRIARIKRAFAQFDILYSIKANPNPAIVGILLGSGLGAGVSSYDELMLVLRLGCPPERVVLGGPGHRRETLEAAVEARIGMINVESKTELIALEEIAGRSRRDIAVALRINTTHRPRDAREFMAGGPSQFGMDEENIAEELTGLKLNHVRYEGIHTFVASQVLDRESLIRHFGRVADISKQLAVELGFPLKVVNFGGGFGLPYSPDAPVLDIQILGERVIQTLRRAFTEGIDRPRFAVEVGRYLVGECGVFLTQILDVKRSRGHNYVVLDSGLSGLSRPAMRWAQEHPATIVSKVAKDATGTYDLVGPSCMPSDLLCEGVALADPEPGDIVGVFNAGAYGYTMSMLLWASHPLPAEVLFHDGAFTVIRKRLRPSDCLAL